MIYLDHGATSFPKPPQVRRAVSLALETCANPGRGGHRAAMAALEQVYGCREAAGRLFHCVPEQVVCTVSCTHGLNIALRTLIWPGDRVLLTGFEHNAVTRTLLGIGAKPVIAGRKLFDWEDTLGCWERGLQSGVKVAVCTHVSNVFGYILPLEQMAALCRRYQVPLVVDAAQSAGILSLDFDKLGAAFVAMPGHKGLLGPQGTGLLLCGREPKPLLFGGTGSAALQQEMPSELPDRLEAGTLNVPGVAGLRAGIGLVEKLGTENIFRRESAQARLCAAALGKMGFQVFAGEHQAGTVSFVPTGDCERFAEEMADAGVALRAGLHCAPLAHESAGTLATGTVRVSFGHDACDAQREKFIRCVRKNSKFS